MQYSEFATAVTTYGGLLGTIVTAIATVMLWRVTQTLAVETKRLAEAGSNPHVVVTIEHNIWAMQHADMRISNTGNATAYDIQVKFDPELEYEQHSPNTPAPFKQVSVLLPDQSLKGHLGAFMPIMGKKYLVSVSWRKDPSKTKRDTNTYEIDMHDKEGVGRLGASDPLVQIADQLKKMQEGSSSFGRSSARMQVDIFGQSDRDKEAKGREAFRKKVTKEAKENLPK